MKAGALLVRIGRGMIARMEVREIKLNIKRQKEAEEEYERQRLAFRSFMCRKITKTWKKYLKRKQRKIKDRRRNACIKIQSLFRGIKARAYVKWLRNYRRNCKQGATKIQCAYRAHTIHTRLQSLLYWNRFTMALKIQCLYRGYVVRNIIKYKI